MFYKFECSMYQVRYNLMHRVAQLLGDRQTPKTTVSHYFRVLHGLLYLLEDIPVSASSRNSFYIYHYETLSMQYTDIFSAVKIENFIRKNLIFLLLLLRTLTVVTRWQF